MNTLKGAGKSRELRGGKSESTSELPKAIWPLKEIEIAGIPNLVIITTQRYDRRIREIVKETTVTHSEMVQEIIEKAIRNGHAVILRAEDGGEVAYEMEGSQRFEFRNLYTSQQSKTKIDIFPWEMGA
jgi:hypothetical protein